MCLVVLRLSESEPERLVLVGNRDEFHLRRTRALSWWQQPALLAGQDLEAGGTWFAVDRQGRFGVVTNLRGYTAPPQAPSRGELIPAYLASAQSPLAFLTSLQSVATRYAGYNLLLGDRSGVWLHSNQNPEGIHRLTPGYHALGNGAHDSLWPKAIAGTDALRRSLAAGCDAKGLRETLLDRRETPDALLPSTGLPIALERRPSPAFIVQPDYGTRSTTVCVLQHSGGGWVEETSYGPTGIPTERVLVTLDEAQDIPPP